MCASKCQNAVENVAAKVRVGHCKLAQASINALSMVPMDSVSVPRHVMIDTIDFTDKVVTIPPTHMIYPCKYCQEIVTSDTRPVTGAMFTLNYAQIIQQV